MENNADNEFENNTDNEVENNSDDENNTEAVDNPQTFKDLGLINVLCDTCKRLGWKEPTDIQKKAIPVALKNQDIIGLAETGSGKTGAFALPILQSLIANPQRLFGLILTPTRELAYQIKEQFEALGKIIGLKCSVIIGGMDMKAQKEELQRKPHIIVGTPGRLLDHLKKTKGFHLRDLKYLVMDEADRMLNMDFENDIDALLMQFPKQIRTYLFSATMTTKLEKLNRVHLKEPVIIEVSKIYQTVEKLTEFMYFVPFDHKLTCLIHIMNDIGNKSVIIFCMTQMFTLRTSLVLRSLGYDALPLYGKMDQSKRLAVLNKFKSKQRLILLATDIASRGLDIPDVDFVINFDCPSDVNTYMHRVGRTARAGKEGIAITLVDQYTVQWFKRNELTMNKKIKVYPIVEEDMMIFHERVLKSKELAEEEMLNLNMKGENAKKHMKKREAKQHDKLKNNIKRLKR